jgi:hypothetical protein
MSIFDFHTVIGSPRIINMNMLLNFHSSKLLVDDFPYHYPYRKEIKDNEYIINIDNLETNDDQEYEFVSKPNQIVSNAINYRIEKLKEQIVDQNNTIKNQKLKDMIIILQIYKNSIDLDSTYKSETILSSIQKNLLDKQDWINKRLTNNQRKQLKLLESYEYYKKHINEEISNKSETKKLMKAKNKMNDYFTTEINSVKNRIELLSGKLSILKYFVERNPDTVEKDDESYINQYIKAFIDKKNEGDLNEILLYLNLSDGAYYDKIRMKKRENIVISNCANTKLICEINGLIKA